MSALFAMRYVGHQGFGIGVVYVGRGKIVGADAGNGRYHGTYKEEGNRIKGTVKLSAVHGGATLVTGQPLAEGQSLELQIDWPLSFGTDGKHHQVLVAGNPVQVSFEKVGDVP